MTFEAWKLSVLQPLSYLEIFIELNKLIISTCNGRIFLKSVDKTKDITKIKVVYCFWFSGYFNLLGISETRWPGEDD